MTPFDAFRKAVEVAVQAHEAAGGKYIVPLNPRAQKHLRCLIANGHMQATDISIEALMAADKKLGITPWDWHLYS